jgi:hypothetical protein
MALRISRDVLDCRKTRFIGGKSSMSTRKVGVRTIFVPILLPFSHLAVITKYRVNFVSAILAACTERRAIIARRSSKEVSVVF